MKLFFEIFVRSPEMYNIMHLATKAKNKLFYTTEPSFVCLHSIVDGIFWSPFFVCFFLPLKLTFKCQEWIMVKVYCHGSCSIMVVVSYDVASDGRLIYWCVCCSLSWSCTKLVGFTHFSELLVVYYFFFLVSLFCDLKSWPFHQ